MTRSALWVNFHGASLTPRVLLQGYGPRTAFGLDKSPIDELGATIRRLPPMDRTDSLSVTLTFGALGHAFCSGSRGILAANSNRMADALAIVLAAGKGTRMKSERPKVLHRLAGATLLAHVLRATKASGSTRLAVVVGPDMDEVGTAASALDAKLDVFVQAEQLGTADAVKAARPAFEDFPGQVLILYGDTPLLRPETIAKVRAELQAGADLVVIGFETDNPTGYGRLLLDERGRLTAIREEKDATAEERALKLCNSGIMGFRSGKTLLGLLGRIGNDNAKKEFYLTDAVALARGDRLEARMVKSNGEEVLGVNSRAELAEAEAGDAEAPSCRASWPAAPRWWRPRRYFSATTPASARTWSSSRTW